MFIINIFWDLVGLFLCLFLCFLWPLFWAYQYIHCIFVRDYYCHCQIHQYGKIPFTEGYKNIFNLYD